MSDDQREEPGPDEAFRKGFGTEPPEDTEAHGHRFGSAPAEAGPDDALKGGRYAVPGPDDAYKPSKGDDDTEAHGARFGREAGPDELARGKGGVTEGADEDTEAHGARYGRDAGPEEGTMRAGRDAGPDEVVRGGKGAKDDEEPGPDDTYKGWSDRRLKVGIVPVEW